MSKGPQPAATSVLLTRPTNAFYGLYRASAFSVNAARHRGSHHPLLLMAALMAVLSEFLPVLLSNVPYALTQTLASHTACTAASLAILGAMILVLGASFRVQWPHMPVDPRSLAGAAYYVADSLVLLRDLKRYGGLSMDERQLRDEEIAGMHRDYYYARVVGTEGRGRMVVDAVD